MATVVFSSFFGLAGLIGWWKAIGFQGGYGAVYNLQQDWNPILGRSAEMEKRFGWRSTCVAESGGL